MDCVICRGVSGDPTLERVQVWEDSLWRLTMSLSAEVLGFSYLEPKRHIPYVTDLNGEEAHTLGEVLARVTSALREETGAEEEEQQAVAQRLRRRLSSYHSG